MTQRIVDRILELYEVGLTLKEISRRLGVPRDTVEAVVEEYGECLY